MRGPYFVSHADADRPGRPLWCVYGPGSRPLRTFGTWDMVDASPEDWHVHQMGTSVAAHVFAADLNAGGGRKERALREAGL